MRRAFARLFFSCWFAALAIQVSAATGEVIKVLPHFIDLKGRHTVSPSLYERDAYQDLLRQHPEKRSGIRFDVQWKSKGPVSGKLSLIVEARGITQTNVPVRMVMEEPVKPPGSFSQWDSVTLAGENYRKFGELTAWRVTLWENETMIGEMKSFLW